MQPLLPHQLPQPKPLTRLSKIQTNQKTPNKRFTSQNRITQTHTCLGDFFWWDYCEDFRNSDSV
jgi:hypothetical protein